VIVKYWVMSRKIFGMMQFFSASNKQIAEDKIGLRSFVSIGIMGNVVEWCNR
jgi:hypothetical protein